MKTFNFKVTPCAHKELEGMGYITTVKAYDYTEARAEVIEAAAWKFARVFFGGKATVPMIDDDGELGIVFAEAGASQDNTDFIEFRASLIPSTAEVIA